MKTTNAAYGAFSQVDVGETAVHIRHENTAVILAKLHTVTSGRLAQFCKIMVSVFGAGLMNQRPLFYEKECDVCPN